MTASTRSATQTGNVVLKAGRVPLEVDWFNRMYEFRIETWAWFSRMDSHKRFPITALSHLQPAQSSRRDTNLLPGLQAEA